jgi:hypothetical protein
MNTKCGAPKRIARNRVLDVHSFPRSRVGMPSWALRFVPVLTYLEDDVYEKHEAIQILEK